jgi:hypothetical protein
MDKPKTKAAEASVGILVLRAFTRPAGFTQPDDPPYTYETRMYSNPDEYLQAMANYGQVCDDRKNRLIEDHRTGKQREASRTRLGPWGWGGIDLG